MPPWRVHPLRRAPYREEAFGRISLRTSVQKLQSLGRAIRGPMPVYGETFEELSGPLVHTNFPRKRHGPMIGPYEFPSKLVWTNGPESSSKVSVLTGIGPQSALPCREEVFGWISLRTSVQKLQSGAPNPGKQTLWRRRPARTSTAKLRSKKLRAGFSRAHA